MDTFQKRDLEEEVRRATSREAVLERREQRDLKKAQATGRVSDFLKSRAQHDETIKASVALIEARDPVSFAQATIQYQNTIGTQRNQNFTPQSEMQQQPFTPIPPLPDDDKIYVLTVQNAELKWIETEDC